MAYDKTMIPRNWHHTLLVFICTAVAVVVYNMSVHRIDLDSFEHFKHAVDYQTEIIERNLLWNFEQVSDLARLFTAIDNVTDKNFYGYFSMEDFKKHPSFYNFGWAPRVEYSKKTEFEYTARHEGILPDFYIFEKAGDKNIPVQAREDYFPFYYRKQEQEGDVRIKGFDIASNPMRRKAIEKARDTGGLAAAVIKLITDKGNKAIQIYMPVYNGDPTTIWDRRTNLKGFTFGTFRLKSIFEKSFTSETDITKYTLYKIVLQGLPKDEGLLYQNTPSSIVEMSKLDYVKAIEAAGLTIQVEAIPVVSYFRERRGWVPFSYAAATLVFTYLIGIFLIYRIKSVQLLKESHDKLLKHQTVLARHIKEQETIYSVLKASLSSDSLETHLNRKLDVILSHLSQSKGCIFLYNEALKVLQVAVHRGFSEGQLSFCSMVPLGKCLCGLAASTRETTFFPDCNDVRHTITYDGKIDQAYYCVPILSEDKHRLLGLINVHVEAGHKRNEAYEIFIKSISHIIAGVILRKQEMELIERDRTEGLTTLSAGIAHEINNPLSFIKGSVSSLAKNIGIVEHYIRHSESMTAGALSDEQITDLQEFKVHDKIHMIRNKINSTSKGVERIMEVVSGLKNFSCLNRAAEDDVDINKCIDTVLSLFENEKVAVVKEYTNLPLYGCETLAMNQCFYHILQNSYQAINNEGTIRIVTSLTGEKIQIKIEDDGIGMSEDAVKRAFTPFFTTKDVGSGKGLGLSIVDGIIKRHNGTINIESTVGRGTSVTIHLPTKS
ncbi:CHASE domain-containing protein [Candidatus Magnetominusculus xianensis]|uniref:histidine kinase n=1 Tax=Candidatus Magnetominusculus xianensis TaxID=1748249 RepID=A0ABR5SK13_9BACT|nr:CHASE domain-containing protein [Candidatus Magnetominusculus xianensis]KWT87414.1 putative signal transduction histidine kinase [Candidatus Magnetominusculus xianensis]MBF0403673.1 CHASE domain-containing protein [Nitrospirota bacterium]